MTPTIGDPFFCSFIYGANNKNMRLQLFSQLGMLSKDIDKAWIVLGDFNCLANLDERIWKTIRLQEVLPLRSCMQTCGLKDMKYSGRFFTWNYKQSVGRRVFSKIDRVLCNELWDDCYPRAEALFLPERTFDHSPMVISFFPFIKQPSRFLFCNFWAYCNSLRGF